MAHIRVTRLLAARLQELGVSLESVLKESGLSPSLFEQERVLMEIHEWFRFWRTLAIVHPDPLLGLKLGSSQHTRIESLDPISLTALSARSFHEGLSKIARYKRLFCSEDMRLIPEGGEWYIDASWHNAQEPTPALLTDSMFATWLELGRRGTGQPIRPTQVHFRRPGPSSALHRAYCAHFDCPVIFASPHDRIQFQTHTLAIPFGGHNPELLAVLESHLEAGLSQHQPSFSTPERVKILIRNRLPGEAPSLTAIAAELHLSPRTLQRHLTQAGIRFQQILEQVRREMAHQYLNNQAFDLTEIAYLLGYQEPSSFHRAFQHWEGMSPGQWRSLKTDPSLRSAP